MLLKCVRVDKDLALGGATVYNAIAAGGGAVLQWEGRVSDDFAWGVGGHASFRTLRHTPCTFLPTLMFQTHGGGGVSLQGDPVSTING